MKKNPVIKLKTLIAEDDEISGKFLTAVVGIFSRKILYAANGAQAVEICRHHPDIDVVLMDVQMPVMDGFEATRLIRQFNNKVIIIAETAFEHRGFSRILAMEAGCNEYITKPIDKDLLIALIKRYFNKSWGGNQVIRMQVKGYRKKAYRR
jgi:CheY-like chemotaxis protein